MKNKIQQLLFFKTSYGNNAKIVQTQILKENRKSAITWSATQMVYWAYCLIMSISAPDFMMCRNLYIMAFSLCAVALILAMFAAPKATWLIRPICFLVDVAVLGAGIGIARLLAPKTIIVFVSVLIVPVLFICDTLSTLLLFILNAVTFTVIGINSMEPETFRWTLVNLLIFSSLGLVIGFFVNKARVERYAFAESAVQLAESNSKLVELQTTYAYYDQMTGLQNRRAYAEKIDQFMDNRPSECCVVMADINGLKEMNDTHGHEAGDELIIGAAECLKQSFPGVELIYRIGGDEFCIILTEKTECVEKCLRQLNKTGSQWKGKFVNGISISCGAAFSWEFDAFDSMLKAADQRMYAAKNDYYMTSGKDRRHI